jgi:hypothetical protein
VLKLSLTLQQLLTWAQRLQHPRLSHRSLALQPGLPAHRPRLTPLLLLLLLLLLLPLLVDWHRS